MGGQSTSNTPVREERIRLNYRNGHLLLLVNLCSLAGLGYLNWSHTPILQMLPWAGLMLMAVFPLSGLLPVFGHGASMVPDRTAGTVFLLLAAAVLGLGWGVAGAYLLSLPFGGDRTLSLALVAGAVAISVPLLTALTGIVAGFLSILAITFFTYLMGVGGSFWFDNGVLFVLFGLFLIGAAIWANRVLFKLAEARASRDRAEKQLDILEVQREDLNQQLSSQSGRREKVERELYKAKEAAEAANLAKSEFLATMSHEVRTPLNGLLPILEMLRDTRLDADQRQFVTTALNSSHHLLRIINDILDYSKIEAGKLEMEAIELDLGELVQSVVVLMSKAAERRGLKLTHSIAKDVPAAVRGDPIRLRQILTNLVSNAVKFTEKGGIFIEVSKRAEGKKRIELRFSVKDTGIGMSEQTSARLFRTFSQADASTTRKHGGTGLGLVICKRLVELMGGQIGIKSREGRGSIFWFVIPLRKSLHDAPSARRDLHGAKILVVDTDGSGYAEIWGYLGEWGVVHERAAGIEDALSKLQSSANLGGSWAYDLVVIDAATLGSAAISLVKEVRAIPNLSRIGFLGLDGAKGLAKGLSAVGVATILSRPVKRFNLLRSLNHLLDVEGGTVSSDIGAFPEPRPLVVPDAHYSWEDERRAEQRTAARPTAPRNAEPLTGRVLVVEDNPVNLGVVKKLLSLFGVESDAATDGMQALKRIQEQEFDLVLMDCQMPRMDGYEVTEFIRNDEKIKGRDHLPVIAMTANAMVGDREKCLAAGMDDYLSKPIKPQILNGMLKKWLPAHGPGGVSSADSPAEPRSQALSAPLQNRPELQANDTSSAIDTSVLQELYEIMEEDFVGLLLTFLDNAPGQMAEIEKAVLAGDVKSLVLPAHSLKSSSANVGAMALSALAKELEMLAREGTTERMQVVLERAQSAYESSREELTEICERGVV